MHLYTFAFLSTILRIIGGHAQSTDIFGNPTVHSKEKNSFAYRLHKHMMRAYKRQVRPSATIDVPTRIGVYVNLYQTINLDQKTNTIQVSGSFELYWTDERLSWNLDKFGGIREVFLPAKKLWTPEISAYYGVEENRILQHYTDLRVNSSGGVRYFMPFMLTNMCQLNVKYFPFDKQTCDLAFGPWGYQTKDVSFHLLNHEADTEDYQSHQEWALLTTKNELYVLSYAYLSQQFNYSSFSVQLHLKRQSFYYVFNLVLPTSITALVSLFGFHLPASSSHTRDAKFRFGLLTVLSMSMLQMAVIRDLPKFSIFADETVDGKRGTHSSIPLIGIYFFSNLLIICMEACAISLLTALERKVRQRQVPRILVWFAWRPKFYGTFNNTEMCEMNGHVRHKSPSSELVTRKCNSMPARIVLASTKSKSLDVEDKLAKYRFNSVDGTPTTLSAVYTVLVNCLHTIETQVTSIRHELYAFMPKNALPNEWLLIISRLERTSFVFHFFAFLFVLFLFFYHDWY